ncbi:facilitated trehalose transporter Tret1-like [Ostrinia furnacalis]|uniref:facilitated trehalose transporter Tret1-like n=1 Tax=Ostrinia furnacalis TaxID=93504 RepID=UPI0010395C02|nr:facilitated trehalose transporter Tret1-like [Ostrinia furnacalis]
MKKIVCVQFKMEIGDKNTNLWCTKLKWTPFLRQINVCFTLWGLFFVSGFTVGTPTVVIPQLIREANSTSAVSESMHSWIGSVVGFSGACFSFIYTFTAHFFGRQKTMLVTSAITFVASAFLYFSTTAIHVFYSQMLYGNVTGAAFTVFPLIFTEYSSTKYRGIFLTLKCATFFWGIWTANVIGIFSHFKYIGLVGIIISLSCFISSYFLPESPYWLAFNSKFDECIITHRLLKGEDENAEKELSDLIFKLKKRIQDKKPKIFVQKYFFNYVKIIRQPGFYKPIAISSLVFLIYHLSGKLACAVYAIELMKKLTGGEASAHVGVLLLYGASVLGMYAGSAASRVLPRRTMLFATSTVGVGFLFSMAIYLFLAKLSVISENPYVITVLLVGYSLAICCGPAIMVTTITGELVPMTARSFSVSVSAALCTTYYGVIIKTAPLMFKYFDIHGSFLAFGVSCSVCIMLAYKYLPETKDKSLYEIAALFEEPKEEMAEIKLLQNTAPKN